MSCLKDLPHMSTLLQLHSFCLMLNFHNFFLGLQLPICIQLSFFLFFGSISFCTSVDSSQLFTLTRCPASSKTLLKTSKCQLPLNIYLAHEPDMQDIVKLKPLTQPELKTIIKDFLIPRHDQQLFIEEFTIVLSVYIPGVI